MRVLFLSARVGVGHTAAAQAVRMALRAVDPPCETETVDSYRYAASIFAKVVADGYIGMVKTVPQLYRYIYERAERAERIPALRSWVNRYTAGNLRSLIAARKPDVVVCTHAFPCGVMAEYKRTIDPKLPVMGIVTDFVVHPFWIYPNIDAYAVATPEMEKALLARGVGSARILVSGIPVDPRFAQPRLPVEELRRELDLPMNGSLVLMMAGGIGIGPLELMMRALSRVKGQVAAAVIVGRNARLEERVRETAQHLDYPLRVFGFVENVYDFMHASDVLVSKPGGLTSSEALAAGLPMVLVNPLPGQEERNTEFLVSREAAILARSKGELIRTLSDLLPALSRRPASLSSSAQPLRRPYAAAHIADRIIRLARGGA
ncbi:MAG TPA: glycosyltransferase [Candidatus Acidoferrales bacterium]|nr:glycosyltransferase [Candidatus Acidoferrales bacterium]